MHSHDGDQLIRGAWFYDLRAALLGRRGIGLLRGLADDLELAQGDRVLDVGCGPGRLTRVVAERVRPNGSVVGIDASEEMIRRARSRRGGDGIQFQVARAQDLPFGDAEFDALACTLVLHHVAGADRAEAVREMYRVLKPGGRLVIAEFAPGRRPFGHRLLGRAHRHCSGDGTRHEAGHDHSASHEDEDSLTEAAELAAAAGFTDLATGPTPVRWAARLVGRRP